MWSVFLPRPVLGKYAPLFRCNVICYFSETFGTTGYQNKRSIGSTELHRAVTIKLKTNCISSEISHVKAKFLSLVLSGHSFQY